MEGKKKYFAIILFLFLGLMIFTFANQDNETLENPGNKKKQNKTEEILKDEERESVEELNNFTNQITTLTREDTVANVEEVDNSYENALKAVVQAENSLEKEDVNNAEELINLVSDNGLKEELIDRLNTVKESINAKGLVEKLENMVKSSTNKDMLDDSREYRTDSDVVTIVNNLQNTTIKNDLTSRLETLAKLLDDENSPEISGIENNTFTNKEVKIAVTDNNEVTLKATLNGEEIDFKDIFTEEGIYTVTAIDAAYNETTITFTIDKTAPVVTGVEDGAYYNTDVTPVITDANLQNIAVKLNGKKYTKYSVGSTLTEEGTYELRATDKAGNKFNYITFVIDKTAPVVTVINPNKYQLEVHSTYVDKGYSAYDAIEKDITDRVQFTYQFQRKGTSTWPFVETLDTTKLGTYKVIYTVTDKAGNSAKGTRVVQIVDTTAPLLTLNGEKNLVLEAGIDTYTEFGATVTDNYDETITNLQPELINYSVDGKFVGKVDSVDIKKPGVYKIRYAHKDSSNNVGVDATRADHDYVLRVVTIQDTTAPKLEVNGEKNITLTAGIDTYTEFGATVTDNVDETITNLQPKLINYSVNGKFIGKVDFIDTNKPGTYKVRYEYTDKALNVGVDATRADHNYVLRVVEVKDINAPEIKVSKTSIGEEGVYSKIDLELSDDFEVDKVLINNNEYKLNDKTANLNFEDVTDYVEGKNTVVLKDKYGNDKTFEFILDTVAPEFENMNATMETPAKIVVTDENLKTITIYDKTTKTSYNVKNGYELTTEGYYTITAIDKAGNTSKRWNLTLDNEAPVITIENARENNLYNTDVVVNISDIELQQTYLDGIRQGRKTTLTVTEEGTHTVSAIDKYGHESKITFTIDKTAPTATISYNTKNPAKSVTVTLSTDEEAEVVNSGTWNPNTGFNKTFKKVYTFNTNQTVTVKDKAGNESKVEVVITNIDRTAPTATVTVSDDVRSDNGRWVTFEFNEKIDETNLPQGMTKISDLENTYKKIYYRSGSLTVKDLAGNESIIPFEFN